MELASLVKACKYSFAPNELGYCGPEEAFQEFREFIEKPSEKKTQHIQELLEEFYGFFPYLKLIAEKNSLLPFSEEVLESYWIGNELLEKVDSSELKTLVLEEFSKQGMLPKRIAEKIANRIPEGALPHHSFHVLFVNFITPKLEPILKNLSSCIVSWGKVAEVRESELLVDGVQLEQINGGIGLVEEEKLIENLFIENPEEGMIVSVHWNKAIEELNKKRLRVLQKFTEKNLLLL